MKTKPPKTVDPNKPAESWEEVGPLIDARKAEATHTAYGISRSICGNEIYVDFGDEHGDIASLKIDFRDRDTAWAAYCKGLRVDVKVVHHPEFRLDD